MSRAQQRFPRRGVGGEGDFHAQAVQTFENLRTVLESAGAGFDSIVKTTG
jgi:enamine deaminase RidA (YjgF/YER057c/UK114 family)